MKEKSRNWGFLQVETDSKIVRKPAERAESRKPARDKLRTGAHLIRSPEDLDPESRYDPNIRRPRPQCNYRRGLDLSSTSESLPPRPLVSARGRSGSNFLASSSRPLSLLLHLGPKRFGSRARYAPEGNPEFGDNCCMGRVRPRGLKCISTKRGKRK